MPAHARQPAAQLSALFDRDVEIVKSGSTTPTTTHAKQASDCAQRSRPTHSPSTTSNAGTAAIDQNPIAKLFQHGGPTATSQALEALKQSHWQIHHGFCQYQSASEQRRQLTFDVGELSQQLTQALCTARWSADQARNANVHHLAGTTT